MTPITSIWLRANVFADIRWIAKQRYLWGPDGSGSDQPLAADDGTAAGERWFMSDRNGNVRDVVARDGTPLTHIVYDSYGNVTSLTGTAAVMPRFGFAGMVYDPATGMSYDNARYYDPGTGRFINQDPLGFGGGTANVYQYAENNPTSLNDPTGMEPRLTGGTGSSGISSAGSTASWVGSIFDSRTPSTSTGLTSLFGSSKSDTGFQNPYGNDYYANLGRSMDLASGFVNSSLTAFGTLGTQPSIDFTDRRSPSEIAAYKSKILGYSAYTSTDYIHDYLGGAGAGAYGGSSNMISTVSFGLSDGLGITDSSQYNDPAYASGKIAAVFGRESLITAATFGSAQLARGGSHAALYTYQSLQVINAARSGYAIGNGTNRVISGDNWGYLEAGGGALGLTGGISLAAAENAAVPKTLFHYTNEAGLNGILDEEALNPSLKALNPNDVRYGNGQYLSDIVPGTKTPAQLSRQFLNQPFQGAKFTHYVEVDVISLNVVQGRPGVFVIPNETPLNLTGRIVNSGPVTGR